MLLSFFFLTLLFRKAMTQQFKNSKQQTGGQIIIKKNNEKKKLAERALGCGQNERYRNRSRERGQNVPLISESETATKIAVRHD